MSTRLVRIPAFTGTWYAFLPDSSHSTVINILQNSGHVQTESYRTGLFGPYACVFSRSGTPSTNLDTSFWGSMSIKGYVAVSGRGYVNGKASGISGSTYPIVVHFYNSAAQYWAYADSSTNNYGSPAMKPGTYTMVS